MPVWPSSLPQYPLESGFSREFGDGVLRTDMEAGIAKTRRRFTAVADKLKMTFRMTTGQVNTFRAFRDVDLAGGALDFTWTSPDLGVAGSFRLIGPPSLMMAVPGIWHVSLEMEELP